MAAVSERIYKRLHTGGFSSEECDRYVNILRSFLAARTTKRSFEQEMITFLTPEKRKVHNSIIFDLLSRALQRREGVPDLPVLQPLKEKRLSGSSKRQLPPSPHTKTEPLASPHPTPKLASPPPGPVTNPADPIDTDPRKPLLPTLPEVPVRPSKRPKPRMLTIPKLPPEGITMPATPTPIPIPVLSDVPASSLGPTKPVKPSKNKPSGVPAPGDKLFVNVEKNRLKAPLLSNSLPPPSPTVPPLAVGANTHGLLKVHSVPPPELKAYDNLPFVPTRPGFAMDIELFTKLKGRVRQVIEVGELVGVRDDSIALLTHAVELQAKRLLQAAVDSRRNRTGMRGFGNFSCAPIRPFDIRRAALENLDLLMDESVVYLERLSMLL